MPDQITPSVEEKKEEDKPKGLHEQSMAEVVADIHKERQEAKTEITSEKPQKAEATPKLEEKEIEAKKEQQRLDDSRREEAIAKKAADEVIAKQKAEEEKRIAAQKAEEDRKKKEEELKPVWQRDPNAPKDEKGNPLPRSYDEIAAEAARIGEERALARMRAEQAEKDKQTEAARLEEQKKQDIIKQQQEEQNKKLQSTIEEDLNDLYASNKLPKIVDPDNPNDPGMLAKQALFKKGIEINLQRKADGKPPISSIKLIYYEHYQPPKPPAGHTAPVQGNTQPPVATAKELEYNFARDHKKDWRTYLKETRDAITRTKSKN